MAPILAMGIIVLLFLMLVVVVPEVQAIILSFFNNSPIKFVDVTPITVILHEGQTQTINVNVKSSSEQVFTDMKLDYEIGNYDPKYLLVKPSEFKDNRLLTDGDRTGDTPIKVTAIKLAQGDEVTYWGKIQVYSGEKLMDTKPIKIIIRG